MINFESDVFCKRAKKLFGDMGQMELAVKIGISQGVISSIKNNKAKAPAADTIFRIARYFNVSADYLLGLSDVPSVDVDLKAVCDYTGLSLESVVFLNGLKKYDLHDASEILLGNVNNVEFFAELSDMIWESKEIARIKKTISGIEEKNADFIKRAGEREIPLEDLTDTEKKAFDEYYGLKGVLMMHERERSLSYLKLCKRIHEIASELEREGSTPSENT